MANYIHLFVLTHVVSFKCSLFIKHAVSVHYVASFATNVFRTGVNFAFDLIPFKLFIIRCISSLLNI